MGLFSNFGKNANETAYVGGKKHFIDVIKNTSSGKELIWRQPEEDFNTNSKLIVMPGEQAIFVDGGNIVQTFTEGTYELTTNNYPFISRLKNALSGGISTFNCVVYFFRKADSEELKWGTDAPIPVRDRVHNIVTEVRSRGTYKVRIENPALFLDKLVGSNIRTQEQNDLNNYFRHEMLSKIKSEVTKFFNQYPGEFIGIQAYLEDISQTLSPKINETISAYGLYCSNFSISALDVDTTKYNDLDTATLAASKKVTLAQGDMHATILNAQGERAAMDTLGINWQQKQNADIMKTFAQNQGAGGLASLGAGLGVGVAAGGAFGQMAGTMFNGNYAGQPMQQGMGMQPGQPMQPGMGMQPGQQTQQPVQQAAPAADDPMVALTKLKQLLDNGLIAQAEYDAKKSEILSRL